MRSEPLEAAAASQKETKSVSSVQISSEERPASKASESCPSDSPATSASQQSAVDARARKPISALCNLEELLDGIGASPQRTAAPASAKTTFATSASASSARVRGKRVAMLKPPPPQQQTTKTNHECIPAHATLPQPASIALAASAAFESDRAMNVAAAAELPPTTIARSQSASSNASAPSSRRRAANANGSGTSRQRNRVQNGNNNRSAAGTSRIQSINATVAASKSFSLGPNASFDQSIDEGLSSDEDTPKFRSIHALREAGETKRFRDEMAYLFEGLSHDQPKDVRRAAALDLFHKLNSERFVANVRAHACATTILDTLFGSDDPALQFLTMYFIWVLLRDVRNIEPLSSCDNLPAVVVQAVIVSESADPLAVMLSGSKQDRSIAQTLLDSIRSSVWTKQSKMDPAQMTVGNLGVAALADISKTRSKLAKSLLEHIHTSKAFPVLAKRVKSVIRSQSSLSCANHNRLAFHLRALEFTVCHLDAGGLAINDASSLTCSVLDLIQRLSSDLIVIKGRKKSINNSVTGLLVAALRAALTLANVSEYLSVMNHKEWIKTLFKLIASIRQHGAFCKVQIDTDQSQKLDKDTLIPSSQTETPSSTFDLALMSVSFLSNLVELDPSCANMFEKHIRITNDLLDDLQSQLTNLTDSPDDFVMTAQLGIFFSAIVKQSQLSTEALRDRSWFGLCDPVRGVLRDFAEFHERITCEHVALTESEERNAAATKRFISSLVDCLDGHCNAMHV